MLSITIKQGRGKRADAFLCSGTSPRGSELFCLSQTNFSPLKTGHQKLQPPFFGGSLCFCVFPSFCATLDSISSIFALMRACFSLASASFACLLIACPRPLCYIHSPQTKMRTCTHASTFPSTRAGEGNCICRGMQAARMRRCPIGVSTCSRILHSSSFSLRLLHLLMNLPKLASVTRAHWKYFSCTSAHAGYLLGFATCKKCVSPAPFRSHFYNRAKTMNC